MNKIIILIGLVFCLSTTVLAAPFLVSDPATDLTEGSVFQIMIDNEIQPEVYPVVEFAVKLDVQNFEGSKSIKVRFGNPWPDLPNTYKWSDWSSVFSYAFPLRPGVPAGMAVSE